MPRTAALYLLTMLFSATIPATAPAGDLTGRVEVPGWPHGANIVVSVDSIPGMVFEPPAEPVQINQKSLTFTPHVVPVLVGTTVEFRNSDPLLHNVFSPNECVHGFDLGTWPEGEVRTHVFDRPCEAVLLCNIHPEMEAYVVVLETPYFAVTDENGAFTIEGVPPGTHTLTAWHERRPAVHLEVTVPVEGVVELDIVVEPEH